MTAPAEPFTVWDGSALHLSVTAARAARDGGDRAGTDGLYVTAVDLAADGGLAAELAAEHVDALRALGLGEAALDRAADYRERFPAVPWLRLVEAQVRATRGELAGLDAALDAVDRLAARRPLRPVQDALRLRLRGLAAQDACRYGRAEDLLRDAVRRYRDAGEFDAVTAVSDDLVRLRARDGVVPDDGADLGDPGDLAGADPARVLTRVLALQAAGRYERALTVLRRGVPALTGAGRPGPEYPLREAEVRLLRLLRRHDEADGLVAELYRAAERSPQPDRNHALAARFDRARAADRPVPPGPGGRIEHARGLVAAGLLDDAEAILDASSTPEPDRGHEAHRLLLEGELALRRGVPGRAVESFRGAARLAGGGTPTTIAIAALRRLGEAHEARGDLPSAVDAWAEAHRHEERLAALQDDDRTRIEFLADVSDEFDEQVRVAYGAFAAGRPMAAAAVATAIEAGRGAAILHRIRREPAPVARDIPAPGDELGAWRWVARVRRGLGRSRAVWMLHPGPDAVHHVLIDRWGVAAYRTVLRRDRLIHALNRTGEHWAHGGQRLVDRADGFAACLDELSGMLGVADVLEHLPRRVQRIAVVAGAELSDVPFTALPCPGRDGGSDVLGCRFALSDLPCLSVGEPLREQALRRRSTTALLVQPSPDGIAAGGREPITPARHRPGRTVLTAGEATPPALAAALTAGFGTVRIDSHGESGTHRWPGPAGSRDADPVVRAGDEPPVLFLWPVRPAGGDPGPGDLHPSELGTMTLRHTGTLIVGACRSGMSTRRLRDERTGFVRSGLLGGATAVLAARWDAEDRVAARLLDDFETHLRVLPRDLALRQALRAVRAHPETPSGAAGLACWGGWTLYGDPGRQTRCDPVRRGLARWRARGAGGGRG